MRKTIFAMLALALAFNLTACYGSGSAKDDSLAERISTILKKQYNEPYYDGSETALREYMDSKYGSNMWALVYVTPADPESQNGSLKDVFLVQISGELLYHDIYIAPNDDGIYEVVCDIVDYNES